MDELYRTLKLLEGKDMKASETYAVVLREIARRKAQESTPPSKEAV